MSEDEYLSLKAPAFGEYRDRGSKFLAYAFPAASELDWQQALEKVKSEHPKARHHCYAFRLGQDKNNFRANDDGEPSGSAGRPILGQIDSAGLTNVIVIVVRYFGGTKLGIPGLIAAYKGCTKEALDSASIAIFTIRKVYEFRFGYEIMSQVMNAVKKANGEIVKQEFTDDGRLEIAFPQSEAEAEIALAKARIANISLEEFKATTPTIAGLKVTYLRMG